MTRILHGVTVDLLPESPAPGVQLYCARCQGEYSASRGDYFWMPRGQPFRCQQCRSYLQLVRKSTVREAVSPTGILTCAMDRACTAPVTYIDAKGYVYCTVHGQQRQQGQRCRQLRPAELTRLQAGEPLKEY